jgi:hypothetical protein
MLEPVWLNFLFASLAPRSPDLFRPLLIAGETPMLKPNAYR